MTDMEVIRILHNEILCILTANDCKRDCKNCPLVLPAENIIQALEIAIESVKRRK